MNLRSLTQIERADSPIHYRQSYTAVASFELRPDEIVDRRVKITLEQHAIGDTRIDVKLTDEIDYPLLPILEALRSHVREALRNGGLE